MLLDTYLNKQVFTTIAALQKCKYSAGMKGRKKFMKTENETIFASRTKNIRALVAMRYFHNGTTSPSRPTALDDRD
jgi:hypothetical protein